MPRSEEFTKKYESLQTCYLNGLPDKLDSIDKYWSMLNNVNWSFEQFEKMQKSVHHIAGSAGDFGLSALSEEAQTLDGLIFECIQGNQIPDYNSKSKVSSCIQRMFDSAGVVNKPESILLEDNTHSGKKILIIDDDHEQTPLIELLCSQLACKCTCIHSLDELDTHFRKEAPDIILMDVVFPEGQFAGIEAIKNLNLTHSVDVPVIFMSSRNDLSSRLRSYRAGGQGYLTKPFGGTELKIQLDLVDSHVNHHAKVLIVSKEENEKRQLTPALKAKGFYCSYTSNPAVIIHMLERHTPDILILDLDTPSVNGADILNVLRQEAKYMHLPILAITGSANGSIADRATAHGASGVMHKPIHMDELSDAIENLIVHAETLDSIMNRVIINNPKYSSSIQSSFFYSLVENCIHTDTEVASNILVCISVRNHEKVVHETGLTHIEDLNHLIIDKLNHYLSDNEKITKISDLRYGALLSARHETPLEQRLNEIKHGLDLLPLNIESSQLNLESCYSAIHLSDDLESVDEAFKYMNDAMFSMARQNDVSVKILHTNSESCELTMHEIKEAIAYSVENSTLFMSYQPIIDTNGEEKIFEGLSRIKDSEGRTLMPNIFMQGITDDDKKEEFNRSLVQAAIDDLSQLKGLEAEEIEIIVKIFILEKSSTPFLSMASNILRSSRIRGNRRIIFSISEEDAVMHPSKIEELHEGVKSLNCSFLLDHGGASKHTQSIIDNDHFDYVKLSANIIQNIKDGGEQDIELVKSLLEKDVVVIAPYIEDNITFSALWKIGVRYFQGYFVRKPEPSLHFDFKLDNMK